MIEIIKELNIEVSKPNVFQAVVAKQYDMNTRFIKATFVDGGNKIYIDPDATVKVVINALRQDGQSKGFEGEVNQDGTVTVPLHSWMLELAGTVSCDISVIDTETDDNKKLTTTGFTLLVEQAAFGGEDITSDPQFDVLVALLEASEVAQEALDKSNEANSKYDACVEATEAANLATNTLVLTHDDFVSGGYVEALKELNVGGKFTFWIGTQEQYNAITEKVANCLYLITDDATTDEIDEAIANIQNRLNEIDKTLNDQASDIVNNTHAIDALQDRDYIVEQDTTYSTDEKYDSLGILQYTNFIRWHWRKWASGRFELWGRHNINTSIDITMGSMYNSGTIDVALPFKTYGIRSFVDCIDPNTWATTCTTEGSDTSSEYFKYVLYRPAIAYTREWYVNLYATGLWK